MFSRSDAFHARALGTAASAGAILIPSEIFAETVSLIKFRAGLQAAKDAGEWMRSQEGVHVRPAARSVLDRAWTTFRGSKGRLSYPDAVVLAWSRERRSKPIAFDRAILRHRSQ